MVLPAIIVLLNFSLYSQRCSLEEKKEFGRKVQKQNKLSVLSFSRKKKKSPDTNPELSITVTSHNIFFQ